MAANLLRVGCLAFFGLPSRVARHLHEFHKCINWGILELRNLNICFFIMYSLVRSGMLLHGAVLHAATHGAKHGLEKNPREKDLP